VKGGTIMNNRITILSGHFGSGKTEIAINLALKERKKYEMVAINDLDVINPYFRSREAADLFEKHDIELISPKGNLAAADLPIVSGEIYRVLHDPRYKLIIDPGGDKDGATALGQYYHEWKDMKPEMNFVLNANRPYVSTLEGAMYTVREIEKVSRLKVTGLINNSNIGSATTMDEILRGFELSSLLSEKLQIPLLYTCVSSHLENEIEDFAKDHEVMLIQRFMKLPWE
jgi:hypothetical protein